MSIPRNLQRRSGKWWHGKRVKATKGATAGSCSKNDTGERYGFCGAYGGYEGYVMEKVKGGLIVHFSARENGSLFAHIKCRYCELDLIEGQS